MQPPPGPRLISAAMPPGYAPQEEGEPQAVAYFRIYCGLASLSGVATALFSTYQLVQHRARGGEMTLWMIALVMGSVGFFAHLLGVLTPRRPWMHVAGIVVLGIGLLSSCSCWVVNIPLLIFWLKPEVKHWFDSAPPD